MSAPAPNSRACRTSTPRPRRRSAGYRTLVNDAVADMRANGEPVPEPIADQAYSGKFVARIPPELHRMLAIEAAEAGISLNRLVSFRLATPSPCMPRQARRKRRPGASARPTRSPRRRGLEATQDVENKWRAGADDDEHYVYAVAL